MGYGPLRRVFGGGRLRTAWRLLLVRTLYAPELLIGMAAAVLAAFTR
jgi:hypothetical protein